MTRPEIPHMHIPKDRCGWYMVRILRYRPSIWPDDKLAPWLRESCHKSWKYYIDAISFEDINDAMAFKLMWED